MTKHALYEKLGYEGFLTETSDIPQAYPGFVELQSFDVDKVYFSGDNPVVLFVDVPSFDDSSLRRIALVQKRAWNYRRILLLFAQSETEIRIYNCYERPVYISVDCEAQAQTQSIQIISYDQHSDEETLQTLLTTFSRIGVDCGLLWSPNHNLYAQVNTKNRLDKYLVESLKNTSVELKKQGVPETIIHALLMRSLFVLFLEDKGAAREAGLYKRVKKGATSYFDILKSTGATYSLFRELENHFNGNIFPVSDQEEKQVKDTHLELIRRCFTDGDLRDDPKLFEGWRIFDFKIISIELLSEIYENFLGELKRSKGQFYTPYTLVDLMLDDKLPVRSGEANYNVRTLDPACGSGIFLVEVFKRLVKRWKNANQGKQISFDQLCEILQNNIYGIEIEPSAIKVAAFSLYLALVDELDPKTLWIDDNYQLPYLIFDPANICVPPERQGRNLCLQDTIGEVEASSLPPMALVVGNPPFGTKDVSPSIGSYLENLNFPKEKAVAFIKKAAEFAPDGDIALIFNSKSLTNTGMPYQRFRKWLFKDNYVEKVYNFSIFRNVPQNYGGRLFDKTNVPISIVYFRKETATPSDTIEYWAPKTYVKSNLVDGVVIDNTDIKHIPRSECQKGDSKIWKVAMWGSIFDFNLIARLNKKFGGFGQYLKENDEGWVKGSGYNGDSQRKEVVPEKLIRTRDILRYYTPESAVYHNSELFRKIDIPGLFKPPYICVKEGRSNKEITASLIDFDAGCKRVWCINANVSAEKKKSVVLYINSVFYTYFMNITSASWGIERERSMFVEVLSVPAVMQKLDDRCCSELADIFDKIKPLIVQEQRPTQRNIVDLFSAQEDLHNTESELIRLKSEADNIFYGLLGLSQKEKILVNDWVKYSMDMFESGLTSHAFNQTSLGENRQYAALICSELNSFLQSSKSRVGATVFNVDANDPLNMVKLQFSEEGSGVSENPDTDLKKSLKKIDKYLLQKKAGDSLYVRKQIIHFDGDKIYIIKQNQKRFWTRTQAIIDAGDIIQNIMAMENA